MSAPDVPRVPAVPDTRETRGEHAGEVIIKLAFTVSILGAIGLGIVYWRGGQPQLEGTLLAVVAASVAVGVDHLVAPAPAERGGGRGSPRRGERGRQPFRVHRRSAGRRTSVVAAARAASLPLHVARRDRRRVPLPVALTRPASERQRSSTRPRGTTACVSSPKRASPYAPPKFRPTVSSRSFPTARSTPNRVKRCWCVSIRASFNRCRGESRGRPTGWSRTRRCARMPGAQSGSTKPRRTNCCVRATSRRSTCSTARGPCSVPPQRCCPSCRSRSTPTASSSRRVISVRRPGLRSGTEKSEPAPRLRALVVASMPRRGGLRSWLAVDPACTRIRSGTHRRDLVADVRVGRGRVRDRRVLHRLGDRARPRSGEERRLGHRQRVDRVGRRGRTRRHSRRARGRNGAGDFRTAQARGERAPGSKSSASAGGGRSAIPVRSTRPRTRSISPRAGRWRSISTPTT